ncbi:MAG: Ppx/GppA phosphatase family protein [Alphaproteobacteria bacterium]
MASYEERRCGRRWRGRFDRAGPDGEPPEAVYGALDLGTNNCRLLVATPSRRGFDVVDSFSRIVRLGEGLQASGELSAAAIERTIAALKVCATKLERTGTTRLRSVATEACRRARNCGTFVDRVASETGVELEIIDTAEEARLAAGGCAPLLDHRRARALMFDIGGGSTEVMWVAVPARGQPQVIDCISVPYGVVNMAERWGGHEVSTETYEAMVDEVRAALDGFERRHRIADEARAGRVQVLGSSGTVTTVVGIRLDLPKYQRRAVDGQYLDRAEIERISEGLRMTTYAERAAHPCIGAERADLVVVGCAILAAICRLWPAERLRVGDRGVREGILLSLMAADRASSA